MSVRTAASAVKAVLTSIAFWVGTGLLVLWGVTVIVVFKGSGPCEGGHCAVAESYRLLVGVFPGAYLVAGMLGPPRPLLTGFMLAVVHIAVAAATTLLPDHPAEPTFIDPGLFIAAGFGACVVAGVLTTAYVGRMRVGADQRARGQSPRWWR